MSESQKSFTAWIKLGSKFSATGFVAAENALRRLDAKMGAMRTGARRLSTSFSNMGDRLAGAAAVASTISIPAAIGLNQTVTQLGDLEKSYANIAAFSGESAENLKALQEQGRKLARTGAVTAPQIATAQFELTKSGWSADDILAGMPDLVKGSVALGLDISPLADKMTDVMAGFGIARDQMTGTMELFAAAVGSSAMNGNQFFEAMKSAGPAAQIAGVPIEQLTTMIAGFADAGLFGAEAGNSLKSALIKLTAPTPKLRKQLEGIGVNFDQVYQKISKIQSGKIKTALELVGIEGEDKLRADIRKTLLDDTMSVQQRVDVAVDMAADGRNLSNEMRQQLEDSFKGSIELTDGNIDPLKLIDQIRSKFKETGQVDATIMREIFGLETLSAGQKFLDQLDSLEERERAIMKKRAGFLGSVYDSNLDTIINAQQRMGNAFKEFFQTLGGQDGETFKNAFKGIADTIFSITDALRENPEAARGALKALTGLTLLAPGLMALSLAASGLGTALRPVAALSNLALAPVQAGVMKLAGGFGAMAAALPTSTRKAKAFAKSLKGITAASIASKAALLPLRGALAAVGGAMKLLKFGILGTGFAAAAVGVAALADVFPELSRRMGPALADAATDGLVAINRLTQGDFSGAWQSLKDAWADITKGFEESAPLMRWAFSGVLNGLEETFPALAGFRKTVSETFKSVSDAFSDLFKGDGTESNFLGWLSDTARNAGNNLLGVFDATLATFNDRFTGWMKGIKDGSATWADGFRVGYDTLKTLMSEVWALFEDSPVVRWLDEQLPSFEIFRDAVEGVGSAFDKMIGVFTKKRINANGDEMASLGEQLASLGTSITDSMLSAAATVLETVAAAINQLADALDRFRQARADGKGLFASLVDGLGELGAAGWAGVILAGIWAISKAWKAAAATVGIYKGAVDLAKSKMGWAFDLPGAGDADTKKKGGTGKGSGSAPKTGKGGIFSHFADLLKAAFGYLASMAKWFGGLLGKIGGAFKAAVAILRIGLSTLSGWAVRAGVALAGLMTPLTGLIAAVTGGIALLTSPQITQKGDAWIKENAPEWLSSILTWKPFEGSSFDPVVMNNAVQEKIFGKEQIKAPAQSAEIIELQKWAKENGIETGKLAPVEWPEMPKMPGVSAEFAVPDFPAMPANDNAAPWWSPVEMPKMPQVSGNTALAPYVDPVDAIGTETDFRPEPSGFMSVPLDRQDSAAVVAAINNLDGRMTGLQTRLDSIDGSSRQTATNTGQTAANTANLGAQISATLRGALARVPASNAPGSPQRSVVSSNGQSGPHL
ncbi:phage tail tape measure protein [Roseibium alexandrii]|uniref:Phage tail tape measure protein, TP901 family, core region n=1 Tax=Roseibium alexandrii (strain DSM 17067 / NCIMB 14079 / DFL-11) TaxID=244592 RepID=A0A5E8H0M2_ROSAD|nr:phage tail tape measure protein [Roseibium alexandrii]EEE45467.2 phage tail tape measure protein, TP901 family, core region [Roseibium alexandrii DFL-11]